MKNWILIVGLWGGLVAHVIPIIHIKLRLEEANSPRRR